jgi:hypothetical protein
MRPGFALFRYRAGGRVSWDQISRVTHGDDGVFVEVRGSTTGSRVNGAVNNSDALRIVIKSMGKVG